MREKDFVEQNKENWGRFERIISGETKSSPDEVSELLPKGVLLAYDGLKIELV